MNDRDTLTHWATLHPNQEFCEFKGGRIRRDPDGTVRLLVDTPTLALQVHHGIVEGILIDRKHCPLDVILVDYDTDDGENIVKDSDGSECHVDRQGIAMGDTTPDWIADLLSKIDG